MSYLKKLFYFLKPVIPRNIQIFLRRKLAHIKRKSYNNVWPIHEKASKKPEGWPGWPDQKRFAFVLMHDVDTEHGHMKCRQLMELEEEMGFRSSFNFVPEDYPVSADLRRDLVERGFEVGVHGLKHDGKLFDSRGKFFRRAIRINHYLQEWRSVGFVSPSMHRNFDWMHELDIEYDTSTFDTDPFEPHPEGVETIFPFLVHNRNSGRSFVELPYTLPQDFTLFIILEEKSIDIWKKKQDWIVEQGGMALLISHPDYMNGHKTKPTIQEYPIGFYREFLEYVKGKYAGQYWHPLPKDVARFWRQKVVNGEINHVTESIARPKVTSIS